MSYIILRESVFHSRYWSLLRVSGQCEIERNSVAESPFSLFLWGCIINDRAREFGRKKGGRGGRKWCTHPFVQSARSRNRPTKRSHGRRKKEGRKEETGKRRGSWGKRLFPGPSAYFAGHRIREMGLGFRFLLLWEKKTVLYMDIVIFLLPDISSLSSSPRGRCHV